MRFWNAAGALALALVVTTGCSSEPEKTDKPATPGNVDMRDYLAGVLLVPWPKDGAGVAPGQWIEIKNTSGGKTSVSRVAVVAEAGANVKIEEQSEGFLGFIEGLTVEKASGKVVEAIAAKKGEKGKDIKIPAPSDKPAATTTTADESVTVPAGTYLATKTVTAGQLSETAVWVGKEGDGKGIILKEASDDTTLRELKSLGPEELTIGGKPVATLKATYSDGSEAWYVRNVQVPFYGTTDTTWVKQSRAGTTTELSWGDGAKAEIDWVR